MAWSLSIWVTATRNFKTSPNEVNFMTRMLDEVLFEGNKNDISPCLLQL